MQPHRQAESWLNPCRSPLIPWPELANLIVDVRAFANMGNLFWKTCIEEGVTPRQFRENNMVPRPDSLDSFMQIFPMGLNSEAAGKRTVILQFNFFGQVEDSCYFSIERGNLDASRGSFQHPDLTIEAPFDVWMDIMTRKADGQQMLMEQKYKVTGDFELLIALFKNRGNIQD